MDTALTPASETGSDARPAAAAPSIPKAVTEWAEAISKSIGALWQTTLLFAGTALALQALHIGYLSDTGIEGLPIILFAFFVLGLLFAFAYLMYAVLPGALWLGSAFMARPEGHWWRPALFFTVAQIVVLGWIVWFLALPSGRLPIAKWILLLPLLTYALFEYCRAAERPERWEDRVTRWVAEGFSICCMMLPQLIFVRLVPADARIPEVVTDYLFFTMYVVAANSLIANHRDIPGRLSSGQRKGFYLISWVVLPLLGGLVCQGQITETVMRRLGLAYVDNYDLFVNADGATLAAAYGVTPRRVTTAGITGESVIYEISGVDLITSIGPYFVLARHGAAHTARSSLTATTVPTTGYLLIPKTTARGRILR